MGNILFDNLEQIHKDWSNCEKCKLSRHRNNVVLGRGNLNSNVLIIGEAPGETEDEEGKCFVGKSGKLLDKFIEDYELGCNCYIDNIVACRPQNNRDPKEEEIYSCYPRLSSIIKLLRPDILLLLGKVSSGVFCFKDSILKNHGKINFSVVQGRDTFIIRAPHPSFFLHNPDKKGIAHKDFDVVRKAVKILPLKSSIFKIRDDEIKSFVSWVLMDIAPDYFWKISASMTGKYHPIWSNEEEGLINHTKVAVKFGEEICYAMDIKGIERDCILAALVIHDTVKYGMNYNGKKGNKKKDNETYKDYRKHNIAVGLGIVKRLKMKMTDLLFKTVKEQKFKKVFDIIQLVNTHEGRFNKPVPETNEQILVHLSDFLSSRKWIEGVNFKLVDEEVK